MNPWSTERLLELSRGFQPACILAAASDLRVFEHLAVAADDAAHLAERLPADPRGLAILLDACAALGLLTKDDRGRYTIPQDLVPLLVSDAPGSIRAMIRHQANCLRRWTELPWIVRNGRRPDRRPSLLGERADQEAFIEAMDNVSRPVAEPLIMALPVDGFHCVLDVGGASGTWTMAWLRKAPEARAILFDLPPVIPMAEARLTAEGFRDRVELEAGDYNTDALPRGADLAWLSAIIHQNSDAENRDLYRRTFEALEPGGRVLIRDVVMEEDRTAPTAGAVFAVNMLAGTDAGGTYTLAEIGAGLEAAGFVEVSLVRRDPGMNSVVAAVKSA